MLTWIIYDISSNKRRSKVAKTCLDRGLYRVQKSVFLGELNNNQIDEVAIMSEELIDKETDSVYIFPLCQEDFRKVRVLGQGFDEELVTDEVKTKFF